jgi:hypothetical protein
MTRGNYKEAEGKEDEPSLILLFGVLKSTRMTMTSLAFIFSRVYTYKDKREATQLMTVSQESRGDFLKKLLQFNSVHIRPNVMKPRLLSIFP